MAWRVQGELHPAPERRGHGEHGAVVLQDQRPHKARPRHVHGVSHLLLRVRDHGAGHQRQRRRESRLVGRQRQQEHLTAGHREGQQNPPVSKGRQRGGAERRQHGRRANNAEGRGRDGVGERQVPAQDGRGAVVAGRGAESRQGQGRGQARGRTERHGARPRQRGKPDIANRRHDYDSRPRGNRPRRGGTGGPYPQLRHSEPAHWLRHHRHRADGDGRQDFHQADQRGGCRVWRHGESGLLLQRHPAPPGIRQLRHVAELLQAGDGGAGIGLRPADGVPHVQFDKRKRIAGHGRVRRARHGGSGR